MSCLRNFFAATQQAILQDAEAKSRTLVAELSQNVERTRGYLPVTLCIYPNSCQCTQHGDALPEYTTMLLHGGCAEWFSQLDQFTVKELQSLWGNCFSLAPVAAILTSVIHTLKLPCSYLDMVSEQEQMVPRQLDDSVENDERQKRQKRQHTAPVGFTEAVGTLVFA